MKKNKSVVILYYSILLGGFILFLTVAIFGRIYYPSEIQNIFDKYPYIIFPIIIIFFVGYIYAIRRVVFTKAFQQYETELIKKQERNKKSTRKRIKKVIPILIIFSALHLMSSVYILHSVYNGAEINVFLRYWCMTPAVSFVVLYNTIYYYKNNKE